MKKRILWPCAMYIWVNVWPLTFLPTVIPGVSLSTMNPVKALPADVFGSSAVRAKTKYQLAWPPFVIHIFWPFRTYSFPFFTALVLIPATSEPAPGSVTQYACIQKIDVKIKYIMNTLTTTPLDFSLLINFHDEWIQTLFQWLWKLSNMHRVHLRNKHCLIGKIPSSWYM